MEKQEKSKKSNGGGVVVAIVIVAVILFTWGLSSTSNDTKPISETKPSEALVSKKVVWKESFMKGLKKVSSIIGRSEPIKMNLTEGKLEMESESDIGRAKEILDIDYKGEDITLNFNVRFVMDVVSHIESNIVVMSVPTTYGAVLFKEENNENYKNIVMPIRI